MTINLTDPKSWDEPLFPIAVAATASRVAGNTMRMWFDRENVTLGTHDVPSGPDQFSRMLTFRSVLTLAATAQLSHTNSMKVKDAYGIARRWTMWGHKEKLEGDWLEALPAGLYAGDRVITVLIHYGGEEAKVLPVRLGFDGEMHGLPFDALFPIRHPVRAAPTLLALNWIDRYARGVCEGYLRPVAM
jgi:hypothetical protein